MIIQINKTKSLLYTIIISLMSLLYIAFGIALAIMPDIKNPLFYYVAVLVAFLLILIGITELAGVVTCLIYDWNTSINVDYELESINYHNKWISDMTFSFKDIESRIDFETPAIYRYSCTHYTIIQLKDGRSILLGMYIKNAEQKESFRLYGYNSNKTQSSILYKELFQYILRTHRQNKTI